MKITRLVIKNYRGIRSLEQDVPPAGVVVKGANGKGKTSVLRAIQAALAAQGIDGTDIRIGSDKAEIMVDLDALKVRRSITAKSSTLKVLTADGDSKAKPQTLLNELLGGAAFDPLNFFLAKAEERRKLILDCMPVEVTYRDLAKWGIDDITAAGLPIEGHGLEVIERLHRTFYERRTAANRDAKEAQVKAEAADDAAAKIEAEAGPDAPTLEDAQKAHLPNVQAYQALKARADGAAAARMATEKTRARIAEVTAKLEAKRAEVPASCSAEERKLAGDRVDAAREAYRLAELDLKVATAALDGMHERDRKADESRRECGGLEEQLADLNNSVAEVDAMAVSPEELAAAETLAKASYAGVQRAKKAQEAAAARVAETHVRADADAAKAKAERLHAIVEALTNDAPADVANRGDMIDGLAFDGDRILLDGVPIDSLCGAEQMKLAVEIARRANAKSKILVVDGLERLDPVQMTAFFELATADDYQLLGTRVTAGELEVVAIERDAKAQKDVA